MSLTQRVAVVLGVALSVFTVAEVNYPVLAPHSRLAIFALLALILCYLRAVVREDGSPGSRLAGWAGISLSVVSCGWVVVQSEPWLERWWIGGSSLGNRAGGESAFDVAIGVVGLVVVLEATRRTIGWALPILATTFLAYAWLGPWLPVWLFPHRGYGLDRIVSQTFLHSQGVFGTALRVMFVYVFLFVLFGAILGKTGATSFVVDFARRTLGTSVGGAAKVSVLSSGMMGSLSGSAVANTATTGTFTIPMMKSSGFRPEVAAGVEAAASSGGALVPPVMGAGAYMMLEIVDPPVTYLEIVRAAILPAALYYFSLLLIVHFFARRIGAAGAPEDDGAPSKPMGAEAAVFVAGMGVLLLSLLLGYTVFRAATFALVTVALASAFHPRTRLTARKALDAVSGAARDAVPLVTAAACVGIVIGVVTLTGIGTRLPTTVLSLAQNDLLAALFVIMLSTIVLGMGLPSAVCYLLMATLIGPVLGKLGVVPLAAHMFIFYFGMMSMVTPPVALAGYTAASIAGAGIMRTGVAAFRFALVGFTLPYMFVFRPQLLMLDEAGGPASWVAVAGAVLLAAAGIVAFAAGISAYLLGPLGVAGRAVSFVAAGLLLVPAGTLRVAGLRVSPIDLIGAVLLAGVAWASLRAGRAPTRGTERAG